ncbi:hypothetical protein [Terrarubrum flagellatum]|uniref:hypothetical protein n=1 Tax=Terrirubrum flagellatum TaxID=2895980 RepID=UPI003145680E
MNEHVGGVEQRLGLDRDVEKAIDLSKLLANWVHALIFARNTRRGAEQDKNESGCPFATRVANGGFFIAVKVKGIVITTWRCSPQLICFD